MALETSNVQGIKVKVPEDIAQNAQILGLLNSDKNEVKDFRLCH